MISPTPDNMRTSSTREWGTFRLLPVGLIVAIIVATIPMISYAQPPRTLLQQRLAASPVAVRTTSPNDGEISGATDEVNVKSAIAETEIQVISNNLRRELLDDRSSTIDWWLTTIAIVLAFFGIIIVIAGFLGVQRFLAIETEAKKGAETAIKYAGEAQRLVDDIEKNRKRTEEIVESMNAETADDNPDRASRAVEQVKDDPESSPLDKAIARAISLQQEDRKEEAIDLWKGIARISEENDNDLGARAWFSIGYLIDDGNAEEQIAAYDKAIRLDPNHYSSYNNRGNAKSNLKRYGEALSDYSEAIRLKKDTPMPYYNRGHVKHSLQQYEDAIADYDEAIRLKSDYHEAYHNRGLSKELLKRYQAAIDDYDESIRLNSSNGKAYTNRADAKASLEKYDDAVVDYDIAIRLNPDYAQAHYGRGMSKYNLRRYEEAIADYDKVIGLRPRYAKVYKDRANAKAKLERYEDALGDYDEALRLNPDDIGARENRQAVELRMKGGGNGNGV